MYTKNKENKQKKRKSIVCRKIKMEGKRIEIREEVMRKSCDLCMKAHKHSKQYIYEKNQSSNDVVFAFAGSWNPSDWFSRKPFGETAIDLNLYPSMRSIGHQETAFVNEAFLDKFKVILDKTLLQHEVENAVQEKKQVIFTGHSSGGALAMLTTLWFLEKYTRKDKNTTPLCITFGSPLLGDRIFPHAIRRENWSQFFINFVMRYDIVPLIMLAPLSSIEQELPRILDFFNPNSKLYKLSVVSTSSDASSFYTNVLTKASSVASHVASKLMGCSNLLVANFANFVELSPYRPFGTYIFIVDDNKMVVVENPDAVLQMLFHFNQLSFEEVVVSHKLKENLVYQNVLQHCSLGMQNAVYLSSASDKVLEELGLYTRARLCLNAAEESEKQKLQNEKNIDKESIKKNLKMMQDYKTKCERRKIGYYDAFKIQANEEDFEANVARLELAGIWDEIVDMLKHHELPDTFEGDKDWIALGTEFRRLFEPIDIANYYRHARNDDAGSYMVKGRPRRYRFPQRWYDHEKRTMRFDAVSESCFLAEVEDLRILKKRMIDYDDDTKKRIEGLEGKVLQWHKDKVLGNDVFLDKSTFSEWWNSESLEHKRGSCIRGLFVGNVDAELRSVHI